MNIIERGASRIRRHRHASAARRPSIWRSRSMKRGVQIIGTDCEAIERAENRDCFEKLLQSRSNIPQPTGAAVTDIGRRRPALRRGDRLPGAGAPAASCWAAAPCRSSPTRRCCATTCKNAVRHRRGASPCWSTSTSSGTRGGGGRHLRRQRRVRARHHGAGRAHRRPLRRLHQRLPAFSHLRQGQGARSSTTPRSWVWASASSACTTSSSSSTRATTSTSSRSTPALRARCRSCPRPRAISSRTSPRSVILGTSLKEQGIFDLYPPEKERWYVKAPVFSFAKLHGLDAYLSPEMKSTGEAIGYDKKLTRAPVQGAAGLRHERAELRHRVRHRWPTRTRRRRCRSSAGSTTWASTSRPPQARLPSSRAIGIRTRVRRQDQRRQRRDPRFHPSAATSATSSTPAT